MCRSVIHTQTMYPGLPLHCDTLSHVPFCSTHRDNEPGTTTPLCHLYRSATHTHTQTDNVPGWQVTLCDPIWHVSSCSGETSCELLYSVHFTSHRAQLYLGWMTLRAVIPCRYVTSQLGHLSLTSLHTHTHPFNGPFLGLPG